MTKCSKCLILFIPTPSSKGIYCSRKCYWISLKGKQPKRCFSKGNTPWNKGLKLPERSGENHHFYGKKRPEISGENHYSFGKRRPEVSGKKNSRWKGEDASYIAIHAWVVRYRGTPDTCEHCNRSGLKSRQIHWANKSHEYKRDLDDWIRLCLKCHIAYDKDYKGAIKKKYSR